MLIWVEFETVRAAPILHLPVSRLHLLVLPKPDARPSRATLLLIYQPAETTSCLQPRSGWPIKLPVLSKEKPPSSLMLFVRVPYHFFIDAKLSTFTIQMIVLSHWI